jgi:DNA/RNA-binding domain of Phe-tRNA-synthetase-like protein
MTDEVELRAASGFVEESLRAELPGLRLDWVTVESRPRKSPREVARRLRDLSNRYRGANVIALRSQPIPHAYRAFFRQIGLDPDVTRIPSEQVAVDRLLQGQLRSSGLVPDALLVALVETGVPVWAVDAELVAASGLGIRVSVQGDRLGGSETAGYLPPGRLVVADEQQVHGLLFGEIAPGHGVGASTARIALFAVAVQGVPAIHIEEALWTAVEVLAAGNPARNPPSGW